MDDPRVLRTAIRAGTPVRPLDDSEAQVVMTIDAVDTGGRRAFGPLTARHVITTTTIEAADASSPRKSVEIQDGWYIDLPPLDCQDREEQTMLAVGFRVGDPSPPKIRIVRKGSARRGFPLIETRRPGRMASVVSRIEFVAVSTPRSMRRYSTFPGYRPRFGCWTEASTAAVPTRSSIAPDSSGTPSPAGFSGWSAERRATIVRRRALPVRTWPETV
jgi:hypothetical protein